MQQAGSGRRYYRLYGETPSRPTVIGVCGVSTDENAAFIYLSNFFREQGLPVPQVLDQSADGLCYLQEDLGDLSLFEAISEGRASGSFSQREVQLLTATIRLLPHIQYCGTQGLAYERCYPVKAFDEGDFDRMLQSFFKAIHSRYDIEKPVIQRYIRRKLDVINRLKDRNRELQQALADKDAVLRQYAREYYLLGNECITKAKDVRAALANFDKALSLDPTMVDAWVRKGITLEDSGDEHEAMACYNEAVRLSPLNFKALYNRGKLRYKQGDYDSALSDFAKAVKQKPGHATAHDRLGDTFIKLDMPDMAARHWAIAEELREKRQQNNQ